MKVFILLIYVLALWVGICSNETCASGSGLQQREIQANDQEDNCHDDGCASFCFHACCSTYIVSQSSAYQGEPNYPFEEKLNHQYAINPTSEVPLAIWQPPKI